MRFNMLLLQCSSTQRTSSLTTKAQWSICESLFDTRLDHVYILLSNSFAKLCRHFTTARHGLCDDLASSVVQKRAGTSQLAPPQRCATFVTYFTHVHEASLQPRVLQHVNTGALNCTTPFKLDDHSMVQHLQLTFRCQVLPLLYTLSQQLAKLRRHFTTKSVGFPKADVLPKAYVLTEFVHSQKGFLTKPFHFP